MPLSIHAEYCYALVRTGRQWYTTHITINTGLVAAPVTVYIVDRVYQAATFDRSGNYLNFNHTFYDGNNASLGT